ncbi:hypothetical protein [Roseateles microcysteis]|uniref:hypothetical protein n=1 Tax=Roseateles microcysteis TaxID=3119057 RepID=UPI002FE53D4C
MKHLFSLPALLLASAAAFAHGGDDHGSKPPPAATTALPRLEAHTELFELVARLDVNELSLMIDRYASNEPLLNASVELESGGRKAKAAFHADSGSYEVDDKAFLTLLATPGEHALVITVRAGAEADLLDGVLHVTAAGEQTDVHAGHGQGRSPWLWAGLAAPLIAAAAWWRRRSLRRSVFKGGLA